MEHRKASLEPDLPLTNTRQRCERDVKGDGDKKEGIGKPPLPLPNFTFDEVRLVKGSLRRIRLFF